MAYVLAVPVTPTSTAFVALDVTERLPVTDETAAVIATLNTPETTATLGGQLRVDDELGVTRAVPYYQQGGSVFPEVGVVELTIGAVPGEAGQGRAA